MDAQEHLRRIMYVRSQLQKPITITVHTDSAWRMYINEAATLIDFDVEIKANIVKEFSVWERFKSWIRWNVAISLNNRL